MKTIIRVSFFLLIISHDCLSQNLREKFEKIYDKFDDDEQSEIPFSLMIEIIIEEEYNKALSDGSITAYKDFYNKYHELSNHYFIQKAKSIYEEMELSLKFREAQLKNTVQAYEDFVSHYQDQEHNRGHQFLIEATKHIRDLNYKSQLEDYQIALTSNTKEAFQDFLEKYSNNKDDLLFKKIEIRNNQIQRSYKLKEVTHSGPELDQVLHDSVKEFNDFVQNNNVKIFEVDMNITRQEVPKKFRVNISFLFK